MATEPDVNPSPLATSTCPESNSVLWPDLRINVDSAPPRLNIAPAAFDSDVGTDSSMLEVPDPERPTEIDTAPDELSRDVPVRSSTAPLAFSLDALSGVVMDTAPEPPLEMATFPPIEAALWPAVSEIEPLALS